jgi:hypothetical protein
MLKRHMLYRLTKVSRKVTYTLKVEYIVYRHKLYYVEVIRTLIYKYQKFMTYRLVYNILYIVGCENSIYILNRTLLLMYY